MDPLLAGTVVVYLLFTVGLGVWASRRVKSGDDFLLAGRGVPWWLLFCTIGATVVGGGFSVGAVGKTYELGLLMLIASTGGYLQFIFSGLVVAPKFRAARLYTVAGYFEHRFGPGPRVAALVLSLLFSVFVIAAQMAAIGNVTAAILPDVAGSNQALLTGAVIVGGLLVVLYSTAGGLHAVILTDVFQFVILMLGFALTAALIIPELLGSWESTRAALPPTFLQPAGDRGWPYLVSLFFAFLLGETFAPGYVTRFCSGKDTRNIRLGIAGVGVFLTLVFPALIFVIGLFARVRMPDLQPDQVLAHVVQSINHPALAGLIIAALLSAVMSSADSALNSTTAIFIKDLIEHGARAPAAGQGAEPGEEQPQEDQRRTLRLARICTVVLGVVSIAIAVLLPEVLTLLLLTYHIWAPGIIVPILIGTLSEARSWALERSVLAAMVAGPAATMVYRATEYAERVDPSVFGVLVSLVAFGLTRVACGLRGGGGSLGADRG